MRNLKKVLSLVLAVAMMVSICVVGAGAVNYDDFTDKNQITKTQAVETLVSLDVIKGYDNGATFNPTGNVTRAEMATMICRVLAGGDNMIVDATKAVPTYTDVPNTHWAVTYVEYCTSLGIVSGKSPTSFDPDANVTAAEAAKMVMTMLGYNADIEGFKGNGWDINSMAKANTLKLLTNLENEVSASKALTREQVAQLLYNALSTPIVQNYNGTVANTWISSGRDAYQQTLLETKFHAEKLTGVVIANEHASLYAETGIKKGTTELALLDSDGDMTKETKTVKVSTEIMDLGSSVVVFWNKDTKQVLYGNTQDTGMNQITEFTTGTKDITKGDVSVSKSALKNAEYFINYSDGYDSKTVSDYKIKYVMYCGDELTEAQAAQLTEKLGYTEVTKGDAVEGEDGVYTYTYTYTRSIAPGNEITTADRTNIKNIFNVADLIAKDDGLYIVDGEVYVGTQSTEDISDTLSYTEFQKKYLGSDDSVYDLDDLMPNENGNYIKAVDFNNDGDIDYVFKIAFALGAVTEVSKKGEATIDGIVTKGADANASEIVCDDELAEDDVVIYTIIDDIAYVMLADSFDAEVKSYSWKNDEITTTDGDVYGQSGIVNSDGEDECVDGIYADLVWTDLEDADDKTDYTFYTDLFGYVAAFNEVETTNGLLLLTDGYYSYGLNKKDTYKIEYWNSEDESFDTAGVNTADSKSTSAWKETIRINNFIVDDENADKDLSEGWERLIGAVEDAWTNVAAVKLADDTATVKDVNAKSNKSVTYIAELDYENGVKAGVNGFAAKDKLLTAAEADPAGNKTIMTNSKTVFYYVYKDGKNMTVTEKVGYSNSLEVLDSEADINAAYAVVTTTNAYFTDGTTGGAKDTYPVADVVVVEVNEPIGATKDTVLLYSVNTRTSGEIRSLETIVKGASTTYQLSGDWNEDQYEDLVNFTFQNLTIRNGKAVGTSVIASDFAKSNIYAGQINAANGVLNVEDGKYVVLTNGKTVEVGTDTPILTFSAGDRNTYEVSTDNTLTTKNNGDKIIYVMDKDKVSYIINVSKSTDKNVVIKALGNLYDAIVADAKEWDVTFEGENATVYDAAGKTIIEKVVVSNGKDAKFQVKAADGYTVKSVKVGETVLTADNGVYTVENVTKDTVVTIEAEVVEDYEKQALALLVDGITAANVDEAKAVLENMDATQGTGKKLADAIDAYEAQALTDAKTAVKAAIDTKLNPENVTGGGIADKKTALETAIDGCTTMDALEAIYDGTDFVADQADVKALTDEVAKVAAEEAAAELETAKTEAKTAINEAAKAANALVSDTVSADDVTAAYAVIDTKETKAEVTDAQAAEIKNIDDKALAAVAETLTTVSVTDPATATKDDVQTAVETALNGKTGVTAAAEAPVAETVLDATTYTSEVTLKYGTAADKTISITVTQI